MIADDPFDTISGTLGLNGAADTLLVMKRTRSDSEATIHMTGRDIAEGNFGLKFDQESGRWHLLDDALAIGQTRERQAVIDLLKAQGPKRPVEIARCLMEKETTIRSRLMRMAHAGALQISALVHTVAPLQVLH